MIKSNWEHVRRDERGRWTNTPTHATSEVVMLDGSNNGAEVSSPSDLPKPDWQPTMSRANAEAWAADSVIDFDVYHVTTNQENADSIKSRKSQGFDLGRRGFGRIWGDGVYAATSMAHGKKWVNLMEEGTTFDPNMLKLKINIKRPLIVNLEDWDHDQRASSFFYRAEMIDKGDKGFMRLFEKHYRTSLREAVKGMLGLETDPMAVGLTKAAQEMGYDSIYIEDLDEFNLSTGGQQIVVFDPTKVVVIDE